MVEKVYDKIGSIQEINLTAEKLRRIRLFDEIKKLAGQYHVPDSDLTDFLAGKRRFLVDGGDTLKEYETARSKILDEMIELKDPQFTDVIGEYLLKCCEDSSFASLVLQKHKTLQRCIESLMDRTYDMVSDEVKKNSRYAAKAIAGDVVLGWTKAYYVEDDREKVIEQSKNEEDSFRKRQEPRKKTVQPSKKRSTSSKSKQGETKTTASGKGQDLPIAKTGSSNKDKGQVEGQVSLFESGLAG